MYHLQGPRSAERKRGSCSRFQVPGLQGVTESEKLSTLIHTLQTNMHRSAPAHDLMGQMLQERRANLLLFRGQYRDRRLPPWYADISGATAILVKDTVNL